MTAPAALESASFFLHRLEEGGAQKRTAQLASRIADLGIAVEIVVVDAGEPISCELSPGVRLVALNPALRRLPWVRARRSRRVFSAVPALVRYLRRRRPDVLVAAANHTHFAALIAHRLARVGESALVLRLSNSLVEGRGEGGRGLRMRTARAMYGWADGIAAVAPGLRDELARLMPALEERTALVANPVIDASILQSAGEELDPAWGVDDSALIVGVGRLAPQKGFDSLIRAFAALPVERRTRLLILGEGPERPALEHLAVELDVRDRVSLPGFAPNPFPALRRAAVVVSSSRWEGLPGVLVEALALGRPVVGTDLAGTRAVLGTDSSHPIVPAGDAEAIAAAISAQLASPPDPEDGRRRAARFSVDAGARAMLSVLQDVHARRDSRRPRGLRIEDRLSGAD